MRTPRVFRVVAQLAVVIAVVVLSAPLAAQAATVIADSNPLTGEWDGWNGVHADFTVRTQSFTPTITGTLDSVSMRLYKYGVPTTGTIDALLYAHDGTYGSSSHATGAPLAVSTPVEMASLPSDDWYTFRFDNTVRITAGQHYVLGLRYRGSRVDLDESKVLCWCLSSGNKHPGSSALWFLDAWVLPSGSGELDQYFVVYVTPTPAEAAITLRLGTPQLKWTVRRGRLFEVFGALKPAHTSRTKWVQLRFERLVRGRWRYVKTVAAWSYSKGYPSDHYGIWTRMSVRGKYRVKAYHPADADGPTTWSGWNQFRVR